MILNITAKEIGEALHFALVARGTIREDQKFKLLEINQDNPEKFLVIEMEKKNDQK